jgi:hypothetical protein
VHADAHAWGAMAGEDIVSNFQPEEYGVFGIDDAKHDGVTDRLDLRPSEGWKLGCHGVAEIGHEARRLLVAVSFRKSREAGDVCEDEGRGCRLGLVLRQPGGH